MKENFLLHGRDALALYETVKDLPVIDYHNHIPIKDLTENKRYADLYELWLQCDPYKHRLMRICGVDEKYITGNAEPYEKFERYCEIFPYLAGNPVYDWSRMELSRVFGIDLIPSRDNARYIYDKCNEMLSSEEFFTLGIISRFKPEYQSPVAAITDDLSLYNGRTVAPSLRADNLLSPDEALISRLSDMTGTAIRDRESYIGAVGIMLDRFVEKGCRFADHSLDQGFYEQDKNGEQADMLARLGREYSKRNVNLLLHIDAKRSTSRRLKTIAGPAGGYAAVGGDFSISKLTDTLAEMESLGGLPDTVIFPLNMSDQAPLSVLQGSFSQDGVASKVQLGPAWWWCDNSMGIENTLDAIASFGVLSQFIGMTTDSRSILSFARHDYFRRILCSYIVRKNEVGCLDLPFDIQADIARKICYENAKKKTEG